MKIVKKCKARRVFNISREDRYYTINWNIERLMSYYNERYKELNEISKRHNKPNKHPFWLFLD